MPPAPAFLIAGLAGALAFEAYAFLASPLLFGLTLEPAYLVMGLAPQYADVTLAYPAAFALHALAGAILFPATAIAFRSVSGLRNPLVWGAVWGVVLWAFAQGVLAPMVGRDAFIGFGDYTWSSLIAHPLFVSVFAVVWTRLSRR